MAVSRRTFRLADRGTEIRHRVSGGIALGFVTLTTGPERMIERLTGFAPCLPPRFRAAPAND
jgi:hypothetical protein